MRVVVVGAGGLGSYVGAVLDRVGHDVTLIARGEHAAAIRGGGLHVTTVEGDFTAHPACRDSALEVEGAELALVGVKAFSLEEVARQLGYLAGAGAVVVSLLNGVTASERLVALGVPSDRIVDGVAYMTAFRTEPGRVVRRAAHHRLVIGSSTGANATAFDPIVEAFARTSVEVTLASDISVELWEKMAVVCALSVLCGLTGESMGPIRAHRLGADIQRRAIGEITAVARARGVALASDTESRIGAILDAFPYDFVPSVIHDLRAGRRTEMEQLGGVIADLGRAVGVDTSLHEAATCAIRLQERSGP